MLAVVIFLYECLCFELHHVRIVTVGVGWAGNGNSRGLGEHDASRVNLHSVQQ